jgi:hypothetical protein
MLSAFLNISVKRLYEHMAFLRDHDAFRWHRGTEGNIIFSFPEPDDQEYQERLRAFSEISELPLKDSLIKEFKEYIGNLTLKGGSRGGIPKNENSDISENGELDMNSEEYKARIAEALANGIAEHAGEDPELSRFPEDVVPIIREVCQLWNLHPPRVSKKKRGDFARWIEDARDLADAAGEFGLEAIRAERKDFVKYMTKHEGLAPYRVEGPGSLKKTIRARAGEMRSALPFAPKPPKPAFIWE